MEIEVVENNIRKKYMTTKRIISRTISIILPLILGTSIELTSFVNIAIYIFILTLLQITVSFYIDTDKFNREGIKEKFSMKSYLRNIPAAQRPKLNKFYKMASLYGIIMDIIDVSVIIITIMTFKTSLNLGILTTIFSICSMISLYLFNKLYKKENEKRILQFCAAFAVFGVLGLMFSISKETLIIFNFTYSVTVCILEILFTIKTHSAVKKYNLDKWVVEYHTAIETWLLDNGFE